MANAFKRNKQCSACPWKKDTVPAADIPGDYCETKHANLARCDGEFGSPIMACHESKPGTEFTCVGWLAWAVNDGNSIPMRLAAAKGKFDPRKLKLVGEQHETLQAMLDSRNKR